MSGVLDCVEAARQARHVLGVREEVAWVAHQLRERPSRGGAIRHIGPTEHRVEIRLGDQVAAHQPQQAVEVDAGLATQRRLPLHEVSVLGR